MIDEALKKFAKKIDVELTNVRPREIDFVDQPGTSGKIDQIGRAHV